MSKYPLNLRDERQMKATLGLSLEEFEVLLNPFGTIYDSYKKQIYEQQLKSGTRKRKPGGGRTSKLLTLSDKLSFCLYYLKNYPTYDVLSNRFNLSRSVAFDNVQLLLPFLKQALEKLDVLPKRKFSTTKELHQYVEDRGIDTLIADATEREHFRYKDYDKQRALYSYKKKAHD
jgi:predicted DNA-binding protein YlxM (UPF0122 family)